MLLRNGHVVTEGWWAPYTPERVHLLYSLSKSFASTAAGFAVAEGLLDLDRTVLSYFPELDGEVTDERSRSMLVRHVAAMASGHDTETIEQAFAHDPDDRSEASCGSRRSTSPATWFAYNQPCTYSLAAIVQRESGQSLVDYLTPRLFAPLGIGRVGWQQHPPGRALGFTGLHATTDAIAKLGQLYLQRGWWGDRRLLPEEWVDAATSVQVSQPAGGQPGLAPGVRLPVLAGAPRLPRRRGVRAVLRRAARAADRGGDHRCLARHAGGARRAVEPPAAGARATITARAPTRPPRTCTWRAG